MSSYTEADDRKNKEKYFPIQASLSAYAFEIRTKVLKNLFNSLVEIPVSLALSRLLDNERLGLHERTAMSLIACIAIWITGIYIACIADTPALLILPHL